MFQRKHNSSSRRNARDPITKSSVPSWRGSISYSSPGTQFNHSMPTTSNEQQQNQRLCFTTSPLSFFQQFPEVFTFNGMLFLACQFAYNIVQNTCFPGKNAQQRSVIATSWDELNSDIYFYATYDNQVVMPSQLFHIAESRALKTVYRMLSFYTCKDRIKQVWDMTCGRCGGIHLTSKPCSICNTVVTVMVTRYEGAEHNAGNSNLHYLHNVACPSWPIDTNASLILKDGLFYKVIIASDVIVMTDTEIMQEDYIIFLIENQKLAAQIWEDIWYTRSGIPEVVTPSNNASNISSYNKDLAPIIANISSDITSGIADDGIISEIVDGIISKITAENTEGIIPGIAEGIIPGIADGIIPGIADAIIPGIADGIIPGIADGIIPGIAEGIIPDSSVPVSIPEISIPPILVFIPTPASSSSVKKKKRKTKKVKIPANKTVLEDIEKAKLMEEDLLIAAAIADTQKKQQDLDKIKTEKKMEIFTANILKLLAQCEEIREKNSDVDEIKTWIESSSINKDMVSDIEHRRNLLDSSIREVTERFMVLLPQALVHDGIGQHNILRGYIVDKISCLEATYLDICDLVRHAVCKLHSVKIIQNVIKATEDPSICTCNITIKNVDVRPSIGYTFIYHVPTKDLGIDSEPDINIAFNACIEGYNLAFNKYIGIQSALDSYCLQDFISSKLGDGKINVIHSLNKIEITSEKNGSKLSSTIIINAGLGLTDLNYTGSRGYIYSHNEPCINHENMGIKSGNVIFAVPYTHTHTFNDTITVNLAQFVENIRSDILGRKKILNSIILIVCATWQYMVKNCKYRHVILYDDIIKPNEQSYESYGEIWDTFWKRIKGYEDRVFLE